MNVRSSRNIFGAEIQYFRTDPRHWETILRRFADTGLRCVTTYVQWGTHLVGPPDAKHPAGILDFEGRTDPRLNLFGFLDLVQKAGLDMNFRCGPFCCNEAVHGGYPPWLVFGDPSMMVWDWQNRTTQGYWIGRKEGSQPSYLHPVYLDWCRKWLDAVDRIIQPRLRRPHALHGAVLAGPGLQGHLLVHVPRPRLLGRRTRQLAWPCSAESGRADGDRRARDETD